MGRDVDLDGSETSEGGLAFVAAGLALGGVVAVSAPASAAPATVDLTRSVTVPTPPSSNFTGATSGDGWDVQFYEDRIFNVFHHNSTSYQVDCHLQSDGTHCDTVGGVIAVAQDRERTGAVGGIVRQPRTLDRLDRHRQRTLLRLDGQDDGRCRRGHLRRPDERRPPTRTAGSRR